MSLRPLIFLALAAAWTLPAGAADYLPELQASARAQHLAEAPEWRALLHYDADLLGRGYTSEAVTPAFFLAEDGRHDPWAELDATLAAFFTPPPPDDPDASPQCLFIARYQWLKSELHFDPARLPERPCPAFEHWYAAIDPGSVVLIFPAAYLNNPSSMYGHTFLRFDHPQQPEETHLESYSVNFAAQTNDTNGVLFAFKGLTGLYPGMFSLQPYYEKVKSYSDIENRDIWEYQLDYTPAEIRRLLEHVWELRQVAFPYYFLTKNCSYALLALMDVARPDASLTARVPWQVIPSDSVKAVMSQPGLPRHTTFRPSLATRMRARLARMPAADQELALQVSEGKLAPDAPAVAALPKPRQADIEDTAGDYLLYRGNRGDLEKQDYAPLTLAVLRARSALGDTGADEPAAAPDTDPLHGHGSSRFDFGFGTLAGGGYAEADLRAAYHDLLDPTAGFVDGAEINMFSVGIRRPDAKHSAELEYLNFAEILSLAPRDVFFQSPSWDASIGWDRRWTSPTQRPLVGDLHGGLGLSYGLGRNATFYGLLDATLLTNGGIPKGYALGLGPRLGLVWHVTGWWNLGLSVEAQRFPDHLLFTSVEYKLQQDFQLSRRASLRLTLSREGDIHAPVGGTELQLLWYF